MMMAGLAGRFAGAVSPDENPAPVLDAITVRAPAPFMAGAPVLDAVTVNDPDPVNAVGADPAVVAVTVNEPAPVKAVTGASAAGWAMLKKRKKLPRDTPATPPVAAIVAVAVNEPVPACAVVVPVAVAVAVSEPEPVRATTPPPVMVAVVVKLPDPMKPPAGLIANVAVAALRVQLVPTGVAVRAVVAPAVVFTSLTAEEYEYQPSAMPL